MLGRRRSPGFFSQKGEIPPGRCLHREFPDPCQPSEIKRGTLGWREGDCSLGLTRRSGGAGRIRNAGRGEGKHPKRKQYETESALSSPPIASSHLSFSVRWQEV